MRLGGCGSAKSAIMEGSRKMAIDMLGQASPSDPCAVKIVARGVLTAAAQSMDKNPPLYLAALKALSPLPIAEAWVKEAYCFCPYLEGLREYHAQGVDPAILTEKELLHRLNRLLEMQRYEFVAEMLAQSGLSGLPAKWAGEHMNNAFEKWAGGQRGFAWLKERLQWCEVRELEKSARPGEKSQPKML